MSKYRNKRENGYASKREAKRAQELKLLEKAGEISNLREQVPFELIPAQYRDGKCVERACTYIADFTFNERNVGDDGEGMVLVVADAKGYRDPVYRIKKKIFLQRYGIRIREV